MNIKSSIVKYMNSGKFAWLKGAFWAIITFTFFCTLMILYLNNKYIFIPEINNTTFSDTIFSNSLNLIFSLIGFLLALIVFLIQYIGAKFDSYELEQFPISRKYFIITPVMLAIFIAFNFMSLYFELQFPYTLISLIFSSCVILLVGVTVLIAFYYLDISNIIINMSEETIKYIKNETITGSYSDEFVDSLNKKASIFIKISIGAIKKDQDKVLRTSLDCLNKIISNYLEHSKNIMSTEDKFLSEMNDQFNFIITEGLNSYNQKILEDIAESVGINCINIIKFRPGTSGGYNPSLINWLATLKDLFLKSYGKDRTKVCQICLEKINDVLLLSLDKSYYRGYDFYKVSLTQISDALSKVDHNWSAIILQKVFEVYQEQFLKYLQFLKVGKVNYSDYFKSVFGDFAETINKVKITHCSYPNSFLIFNSLYGVESFAQRIASLGLTDVEDDYKRNIAFYINQFIDFNKKILFVEPEKNDPSIYTFFSETLFLITKRANLIERDREKLIERLSDILLDFIQLNYDKAVDSHNYNLNSELENETTDYFALLIYLHNNKPDLIKRVFNRFANIYLKIKKAEDASSTSLSKQLYKELKLYSCWATVFSNLKDSNADIIKLLKEDFYELDFSNSIGFPPLLKQYGYPTNITNGLWYLHPSYMWGNEFQEEIAKVLNCNGENNYISFHEMLKQNSFTEVSADCNFPGIDL